MTQQDDTANPGRPTDRPLWFGTWHGCSGTFLGESYIDVPKHCPTHGGPLMAEPAAVTGFVQQVTFGTTHLDHLPAGED